jgi:prepilin-type N-terminal cleavage/methylation domain-containing protein
MAFIPLRGKFSVAQGMTMVELLATVAIIGILLATAIPSFRGLQARESMTLTQEGISALLTRMQQLSLAPPQTNSNETVVGYGIYLAKQTTPQTIFPDCQFTAENDFLALYKFIVSTDLSNAGTIIPVSTAFTEANSCGGGLVVEAKDFSKDFFVLPQSLEFNATRSAQLSLPQTSFPWLLIVPLQSARSNQSLQSGVYGAGTTYNYPLPDGDNNAKGVLVIQDSSLKVNGGNFCRGVEFARSSLGISATTRVVEGC